jgi:hypothetical protein
MGKIKIALILNYILRNLLFDAGGIGRRIQAPAVFEFPAG